METMNFSQEALRKLLALCKSKEFGLEGCTYGDTSYDSVSVAYGYNMALDLVERVLETIAKESVTP